MKMRIANILASLGLAVLAVFGAGGTALANGRYGSDNDQWRYNNNNWNRVSSNDSYRNNSYNRWYDVDDYNRIYRTDNERVFICRVVDWSGNQFVLICHRVGNNTNYNQYRWIQQVY